MIQEDLPSFQYLVLIEGEIVLLHQLHSHRAEQYQEAVIFSFGPRKWMILLPLALMPQVPADMTWGHIGWNTRGA